MREPSLFSILHISDFHFTKRKLRDQQIVVDALVADLKALCIGHRRPDLILFTGDLVQAAGSDRHDDAYDFLIEPVSKATGASDERILLVPGNHDLAWKSLEEHASFHRDMRGLIGGPEELEQLNKRFDQQAFDGVVQDKFSDFFELERYMGGEERRATRKLKNAFATVDHIEALNVDVVTINTAALSTGGHKNFAKDERLLAVPEYALLEAVKVLQPKALKIFATHHPFGMMSEPSARLLENIVEEHADVHLFGHMHDPQPKSVVGLKGKVLSDQAGAIFTARRNAYIGYSLVTIDRANGFSETHLRTYFDDRKAFDEAVDIIAEGRWYPSQEARQHFRKIATPVDDAAFRKHLAGPALSALLNEEVASGMDSDVHEKFIAPPLRRTFLQKLEADATNIEQEAPVAFADLLNGDSNVILYALAEYGRTTLLRELRYQSLLQSSTPALVRLPVLVDFADLKSNADNLLRTCKARAIELPADQDMESLLKLGRVSVLIDDVVFGDRKRMQILRDFVSRFPKARYVLSAAKASATVLGAHVDPEMPVRFEFVEVQELRRSEMRQLIVRFDKCADVEEWLDRLQSEFKEINLPFTAANGSIFMEILQEKHNFTPINRSVLVEQFVDSTLRKATVEQSRRETFDYTNKTDLLAHVASWMARRNEYTPKREEVRDEISRYINSLGLSASLDDLLAEFLAARIFINKPDERLSFRYRAVLEYFVALRMTSDAEFKEWVLAEERYLQYANEIQYYAGKLRNDAALVDEIGRRHELILAEGEAASGTVDLDSFESIELPSEDDADQIDAIAEQLSAPPMTREEKDEELQADFPRDAEDRQEVFRPAVHELGDRMMLSLALYSGVIKNMELIPDADKRRHLAKVWRGWSLLLHSSLLLTPKLARDRKLRVNGVLYEIRAPQGMTDVTLARRIMLFLPSVHIRLLSGALGTEKLERQLTEASLDESREPLIYTVLRSGLIADLRLSNMSGALAGAFSRLKNSRYLLQSLITHVGELRRLNRIREAQFKDLEKPLAGAFANLRGGDRKARLTEQNRQITRLRRERLLIEMKRSNADD